MEILRLIRLRNMHGDTDPRQWDKLASVKKMVFREGRIPMALAMMVIIPKGKGE